MKRKSLALVGLLLALALCLSACETAQESAQSGDHSFHYGGSVTLRILSGSENQELGAYWTRSPARKRSTSR